MSLPLPRILHLAASEEGFLQQMWILLHGILEGVHRRTFQEACLHVPAHCRVLETLLPPTDSNLDVLNSAISAKDISNTCSAVTWQSSLL